MEKKERTLKIYRQPGIEKICPERMHKILPHLYSRFRVTTVVDLFFYFKIRNQMENDVGGYLTKTIFFI
jgi:hypothetical protein